MRASIIYVGAFLVACGSSSPGGNRDNGNDGGGGGSNGSGGSDGSGGGATLGSCTIFPSDFIFNTAIASLPADPSSSTYISTIGGSTKLHLDLGSDTDSTQSDYYGIPSNVVNGNSLTWSTTKFDDSDDGDESDCGNTSHAVVSPCNVTPILPIPTSPLVEGGINNSDNDHHMLIVDADNCRLWELYNAQMPNSWTHDNSSTWDLTSDALRPDTWTSADAAGFPIYPLLLRAAEADTGTINHAVRFTAENADIRGTHVWPARHDANPGNTSSSQPPMGQLFRLKASYQIPSTYNTQAKAILTALQTYGMYLADNGSSWYIQGEPSADWQDDTFDQVQSVPGSDFEAVDITAITGRSGFDSDSGKVPPQ
jgi:hypothetical protein